MSKHSAKLEAIRSAGADSSANEELKRKLEGKAKEIAQRDEEIGSLTDQLEEARAEIEAKQEEIDRLASQIASSDEDYSRKIHELASELEAEKDTSQRQEVKAEQTIGALRSQLEAVNEENARFVAEILFEAEVSKSPEMAAVNEKIVKELEAEKTKSKKLEAEMATASAKLSSAEQESEQMSAKFEQAKQEAMSDGELIRRSLTKISPSAASYVARLAFSHYAISKGTQIRSGEQFGTDQSVTHFNRATSMSLRKDGTRLTAYVHDLPYFYSRHFYDEYLDHRERKESFTVENIVMILSKRGSPVQSEVIQLSPYHVGQSGASSKDCGHRLVESATYRGSTTVDMELDSHSYVDVWLQIAYSRCGYLIAREKPLSTEQLLSFPIKDAFKDIYFMANFMADGLQAVGSHALWEINEKTIEQLLSLASKFNIDEFKKRCGEKLMGSLPAIDDRRKFVLATKYKLDDAQAHFAGLCDSEAKYLHWSRAEGFADIESDKKATDMLWENCQRSGSRNQPN